MPQGMDQTTLTAAMQGWPMPATRQVSVEDADEIAELLSISSDRLALAIAAFATVLLLLVAAMAGCAWIGQAPIVDLRL